MNKLFLTLSIMVFLSCTHKTTITSVQQIVDKSITVSGGERYNKAEITFFFRDKKYSAYQEEGKKVLERTTFADSIEITDVKTQNGFERYINDSLVTVPDSLAVRYSNSINSVHYFSRLPYGLNDKAVNKELLGEVKIKGKKYYKVKVTFDEQGGGEDFEDVYLYWFDIETFKPDYLAYVFHVDGGGIRFREAYNERYVNGIRFVDYTNYKGNPTEVDFFKIDSVFTKGSLELLSNIELEKIAVSFMN